MRTARALSVVAAVGILFGSATSATAGVAFRPGSVGVGDPYFPLEGDGGYRPVHYNLDLSYDPAHHFLSGTDTLTAIATQNLSRFDLDLQGLTVNSVKVNGVHAKFSRSGQELRITPQVGLQRGLPFRVAVNYAGSPKTIVGSPVVFGAPYGWIYTKDGAFVGCEPNAASTWYPSDDHPSRKASFTCKITVPKGNSVMANGDLLGNWTRGDKSTYLWNETKPMATYLATIDIGKWNIQRGRTPGGIKEIVGVDPTVPGHGADTYNLTGQITDYWSKKFGPYAFSSTGAIVDNVPDIGFSLETQTRPLYGFTPDAGTASHELAHQWFGDSVSVADWSDIWLNEGFATFAADLWNEHANGVSTWDAYFGKDGAYNQIPASSSFWNQAIADPQRDTMFSGAVYERGGMTLAALRHKIGDQNFFRILQTWTRTHRYSTGSTAQFTTLASKIAGQNLDSFFHSWLWQKSKPALDS